MTALKAPSRFAAALAGAAGLAVASALVLACALPAAGPEAATVRLTVEASLSEGRSVVADIPANLAQVRYTVSPYSLPQPDPVAYGEPVTFSLAPGEYTVAVEVTGPYGAVIASGSAAVSLVASGARILSVPLACTQSGASGRFSLPLRWPESTGLDYVRATLDGGELTPFVSATPSGGYFGYTLHQENIAGGRHALEIYFSTEESGAAECGPYRETVNIWDGMISDRWIAAGGPTGERLFAAGEFPDGNAALAGFSLSGAETVEVFDPGTTDYRLIEPIAPAAGSFDCTATLASAGQRLEYSYTYGGGGFSDLYSSTGPLVRTTASLPIAAGPIALEVTVTAPDHRTQRVYRFLGDCRTLSFDGNGGWGGDPPNSCLALEGQTVWLPLYPGTLNKGDQPFVGWCTGAFIPSGTFYLPGAEYTATGDALFYAIWGNLSLASLDPSTSTWNITGSLSLSDLIQLSAYLGSGEPPVALDLSGADFPPLIPGMFKDCERLASLILPAGLAELPDTFLQGCNNLASVTLPPSLMNIGAYCFDGCSSLTSINLPEGVSVLGAGSFANCTNLVSAILPSSLAAIQDYLFENCVNLTDLYFRATYYDVVAVTAIDGCGSLQRLHVKPGMDTRFSFLGKTILQDQ
jgi:hypothetical protein